MAMLRRAALPLAALLALPACATGPGGWQGGGWQGAGWQGDAAELWAGSALYPDAAGWWGAPAPSPASFAPHLAGHGRWVGHRTYGRVWLPAVGPGWQPYRFGHWAEHPRWGRTWRSAEPFGWIVYHYGRWGFDPRLGWFWVPGPAFAPHWTDLRWSAGWLAWAPLPPAGWVGWGDWRWGPGGWSHGYPGWVHAPRGAALRPGWTPRARLDRSELDRMQRAPAPAIPAAPQSVPPPVEVARPDPATGRWREGGREWTRREWTPRAQPADIGASPAAPGTARPGLAAPAMADAPPRAPARGDWSARPARAEPPPRPPAAARGGLEQGAAANEP